jgi:hypothetical protein
MALTIGKVEWKIQAVGTGVLNDTLPIELGTMTADLHVDGTTTVLDDGFAERLSLALAAFRGVMNADR